MPLCIRSTNATGKSSSRHGFSSLRFVLSDRDNGTRISGESEHVGHARDPVDIHRSHGCGSSRCDAAPDCDQSGDAQPASRPVGRNCHASHPLAVDCGILLGIAAGKVGINATARRGNDRRFRGAHARTPSPGTCPARGREYLVWFGEKSGPIDIPSGPSCYLFDADGKLLDWQLETGDGGRVEKFLQSSTKVRELTVEEAVKLKRTVTVFRNPIGGSSL